MTVWFFAGREPEIGPALAHYKRQLARVSADTLPRWRVDPGNLGLLSRAASELPSRGATGLTVTLPAHDASDDQTEVEHEAELVPTLRRLVAKAPRGFSIHLELSSDRPYALPPPSLDISTNDLCGLECVMCGNRNTRRDPLTISPRAVRALLSEAAAWGIRRVALTGGGEPLRDPEMLAHVDHAASLGHLVTMTTNGLPVGDEVAARLAAVGASISVSIHGATDATHDRVTGVTGTGARAWAAVRRLAAARDRAGSRGRMFVNVSSVIQRTNVSEIRALVERSRHEGCDGHNLQPVNLQRGSFREGLVIRRDDVALMATLWPTPDQAPALDALFDWLVSYRESGGHVRTDPDRLRLFRRYFTDSSREALGVSCRVGASFLAVDHRGRVKPCYRLPRDLGDARLGSVRRLWNSAAYARTRETIAACPLTCLNNCFFRK